jgi:hypothetical protein
MRGCWLGSISWAVPGAVVRGLAVPRLGAVAVRSLLVTTACAQAEGDHSMCPG